MKNKKSEPHLQVYTPDHKHIGYFDGQFFYANPSIELRVDGDEVYTKEIPCELVGNFTGSSIKLLDGSVAYYVTKISESIVTQQYIDTRAA